MDDNLVDKQVCRNGFVFSGCCILCGDEYIGRPGFCMDCYNGLPLLTTACPRCALGMRVPDICAECLINSHHFVFSDCIAAATYSYPLDKIIQQFKFNGKITYAQPLGRLLEDRISGTDIILPECLIPVPLHFTRRFSRGYNQSTEIARMLSRRFGILLDQRICKKIRPTRAQSLLRAEQRKRNIRGSFEVIGKVNYQHVAIVDDVMTTGNTVNELAKILIGAGVRRVSVWVCARSHI